MSIDDKQIDALFSEARNHSSQVTVEEMKSSFLKSVSAGGGSGLPTSVKTNPILRLKTLLIMTGIIGTIAAIALFFAPNQLENPPSTKKEETQTQLETNQTDPIWTDTSKIEIKNDIVCINNTKADLDEDYEEFEEVIESSKSEESVSSNESDSVLVEHEIEGETKAAGKHPEYNLEGRESETSSFTITEKTTEEDLKVIKAAAEKAGIVFTYRIKEKRNRIRLLSLKLTTSGEAGKRKTLNYYYKGGRMATFVYDIEWRKNEDGVAIDFAGNGCSVRVSE